MSVQPQVTKMARDENKFGTPTWLLPAWYQPAGFFKSIYPLIGLYPLERVFAHILTGHAMRALRSSRIISASAHPVSMQERVKSFPSVSGKASGSAGCPRTERGKLTVFDSRCANSFRGPQKRGFAATSQTWENAAQPSASGLRQPPKGLSEHGRAR